MNQSARITDAQRLAIKDRDDVESQLREHRKTCSVCVNPATLCPVGMKLSSGISALVAMNISDDAKFIASKIVTHMWIIFVLLPLVLFLVLLLMKANP